MPIRLLSLKAKLYIVLLIPFAVLSLASLYGLDRVIGAYGDSVAADRARVAATVTERIEEAARRLDNLALNLAGPREVVSALHDVDNGVLSKWALSFLDGVDAVLFVDGEGLVVARQPDEFVFGYSVAEGGFLSGAREEGHFVGLSSLDGRRSLVACRPVYRYGDDPIGFVVVGRYVTAQWRDSLLPRQGLSLSYDGGEALGIPPPEDTLSLETSLGAFSLSFSEDRGYSDLRALRRFLLLSGVAIAVSALVFLLLFLERQYAPYRRLALAIRAYSEERTTLDDLHEDMARLHGEPSSEISAITAGLCSMIDLLQANFRAIEAYTERLREMAERDDLTGLWNRRYLDRALAHEVERGARYGSPLSVVMIDLDHFKRVNDNHGHGVGDLVLSSLGKFLRKRSRAVDLPGRWGGEEFLVICPGLSLAEARLYAERLRQELESLRFHGDLTVTASFGLAQYALGEAPHGLVARADGALYRAKAEGRNRVESAVRAS